VWQRCCPLNAHVITELGDLHVAAANPVSRDLAVMSARLLPVG
jgi:hypothetical protein